MTPRLAFVPLLSFVLLGATAPPGQVLAGPAFERFAARADAACPAAHARLLTPGDLDWEQEGFEDGLPVRARARLVQADAGPVRCAGHNGLSCPSIATLQATERTHRLGGFVSYVCDHAPPTRAIVHHCASRGGGASRGPEDTACNSNPPVATISRPSRHS